MFQPARRGAERVEAGCRAGDHRGGPPRPGELLVAAPAIFAELQGRLAAVSG